MNQVSRNRSRRYRRFIPTIMISTWRQASKPNRRPVEVLLGRQQKLSVKSIEINQCRTTCRSAINQRRESMLKWKFHQMNEHNGCATGMHVVHEIWSEFHKVCLIWCNFYLLPHDDLSGNSSRGATNLPNTHHDENQCDLFVHFLNVLFL